MLLVLRTQHGQVIERGFGLGCCGSSRGGEMFDSDVLFATLLHDIRFTKAVAIQPDLQDAEVEGIEAQLVWRPTK